MNFSSKSNKFGQSPVAAACVSLVICMASAGALAQSASFGINFPTATATTIELLGVGTYGLNKDFTTVSGLSGFTIPVQSVQTQYSSGGAVTLETTTDNVFIGNTQSGGGTVTANVRDSSIAASGTGTQLTLASGAAATIDLGLMATYKSIGALAVQFLGSQNSGGGQVNVQAKVSSSTVGALFTKMGAAPIAVNSNTVGASATLNEATTVVAGAVPLGFANSTGGSSSIGFTGTTVTGGGSVSGDSTATLSINTLQGTVNGGISQGYFPGSVVISGTPAAPVTTTYPANLGSYAALIDNTIALKSQETGNHFVSYTYVDGVGYVGNLASPDLSSPLTLNDNTQSAAFTGNKATNLLQADASSNAFSGSASVTNAQANVETLDYDVVSAIDSSQLVGPTASVSSSQIVADLTYVGVQSAAGASSTDLTSSLSVSGTALAPQSISAQSIGNAAGSLNSAGQLTTSGNAIEFSSGAVNLTGSSSYTGVSVAAGYQSQEGDVLVNSAQVNQRPTTTSGSGVSSLVSGSGITAAIDVLSATGSVTVNHDAVTSGATGNLAGNLINAKANNVNASMAVVGTQQNSNAAVLAQNISSSIGAGVGDAAVTTNYTVAERAATTAVLGSITVNDGAIGAVAEGNLAANTLLVAAGGTLTAQSNYVEGGDFNNVSGGGASVDAGLVAVNVQGNTASAAEASVIGGRIFIAGVDQAGTNQDNLVPLGAATLSASSNRISALAQGNNGGTNIGVTAGNAIALTAAAANSQNNDSTSPVTAMLESSSVLVSGLSSAGTTIASNSNTLGADATGNLGANSISISGGSTVNGSSGVNTSDLQSLQGNAAAITAGASGSAVGVLLGALSSNVAPHEYGYATTANATWADPSYTASAVSTTDGNFTDMLGRNITTVTGATLAVNSSTVAANATANQVNNNASLFGTTLGNIAPVASVIGSVQNNSGAVDSSVISTDVGVRLIGQSNNVSSTPTYTNSATTTNSYDANPFPSFDWVNVDLNNASAVAANSVSGSGAGSITAIDTTTASVSASTLEAASSGNVAGNLLRLNGTDVTLPGGAALALSNTQTNAAAGALTSSVSAANVGVLVGSSTDGVTGTGTSTLLGTVSATVVPTILHSGTSDIFNGSGSATIDTPVVGSMAATGINALTAQVDDSVLSATSIANSADNRIIVGATKLTAAGSAPNAVVSNTQTNGALFSAALSTVDLGVVLADVDAHQITTVSGSATTKVATTNTDVGSSISTIDGAVASTTLSASGSATALGVSGSTVSVQGSALTATAKGNTVTNVIDLGSTVANAFGVQINNGTYVPPAGQTAGYYVDGQSNTGVGSATLGGVSLGTVLGAVAATSTSTSTANATVSGSATDVEDASVTNSSATASGSATAVATATGLRNSTSTVSGNSLMAIGFGNEAINVASGSGTVIGAVSNQAAANVISSQYNNGALTAAVGKAWVDDLEGGFTLEAAPIRLGTVVGAVSSIGSALVTSTASGSAVALADATTTNGESTTADFVSNAVTNAAATVNATGISGLTTAADSNRVEAANTGNSAVNAIRLASTTITGSTGAPSLANRNSQVNEGDLSASVANVGLGVLLTSVDATGSASGSASATAVATATDSNTSTWASGSSAYTTNTASATASGGATSTASGSATAVGIEVTNASVATNVLRAANTGNSASTLTSLSASSLTGVSGSTTVSGVSSQTNSGALTATLDTVAVGVSGGAVTTSFNASGSATATSSGSTTAYNWYDSDGGIPVVNASSSSSTPTLSTTATATANAMATATGMTGSTFNVLSNQLEASNVGNSAYTSAVLDGTVLGTALLPVSATQTNSQTNAVGGSGIATASNIMLGVMQADVSATASGSASYTSSTGTNTATATASASGIVNSTLSVGGTQATPQTVTAQSVGNSATTLIAATQTTGAGSSGSATLTVSNTQGNAGAQTATVGQSGGSSSVTVGVKLANVTASADATATQTYATGYWWSPEGHAETATATAVGISGGSVAVEFNQLAALSYGNSASNSLASTSSSSLGGSSAAVPTFSLGNTQTNTAATASSVRSADIGVVVGDVMANANGRYSSNSNAVAINAAQINVSNNQSLATSMGNVADNRAVVSAGLAGSTELPVSSLVASGQSNDGAQTALVDAQRVGVFTGAVNAGSEYGVSDSALTVNGNELQAATYGNRASNVNELLASNTANIGAVATRNEQLNTVGGEQPSTISNTTVGVGIASADWALDNTPTTVQANTLAALSYGNSASNSTNVSGGTTLTASSVATAFETSNTQTNAASMVSLADTVQVGVMIGTGIGAESSYYGIYDSPIVVKDNAVSVLAYANQASNALSLSAGNVIDGNSRLALVSNSQTNQSTGTAESTLRTVDVGVLVNASQDVGSSAVTVDGNRLTAASYLNTASNSLSLAAQVLDAPATVTSTQTNAATGLGKISGVNVGVLPADGAANILVLNDVTSTVSNNALNAQAGGNTASNALNVTASATIANAGPSFQVLNAQGNTGVMTALLENAHVGNWGNSGSNYGYKDSYYSSNSPTTMTVSMNSAVASAYGNTASNALSMSALTGASNSASTGLSNSQSNTASLNATVSGVLMGVGSGQGTGTVAVSGNSIVASTVGNAASNRVGIVR